MRKNQVFKQKITKEEINVLPRKSFNGEIIYVDSPEAFHKFFPEINGNKLLGFDTETKPSFKKGENNEVALLQLSTAEKAFLFRLNFIGMPSPLAEILSDPNVIKAGVALRDDISGLQKLRDFEPAGFIDLQDYVKEFAIEDNGLKKLVANILGFQISKRQQTSNWEHETLTEAQIEYAATDAWVCNLIYRRLKEIENGGSKLERLNK